MRVALVSPYTWTVPGGVQSHIAGLAGALRARGHEVDILAPADGPVDLPGFVALGRSIPVPDNGSLVRVALGPAAVARTAERIRSGDYDLVHLHEPMIPAACLTALLQARSPLVGTFHMYSAQPRWYRPFAPLARWALARLDARIAVSEAARRHVVRTCPGEYRVIPNGLDAAAFATLDGRRRGDRLLFVGRPERRKGLPVLLEAFARLPGAPTLELVGVSERQLARIGHLGGEVRTRVRARGRVADDERRRVLAGCDVLCAPSLEGESFGIVLVEGMAAGIPVVASAIPGYVDVLPPACGRLVAPGDPEALASSLSELLGNADLRRELGEAGRRQARRYDWARVCGEILEVYEEALGRHQRRVASPDAAAHRPRSRRRVTSGDRAG